MKKTFLIIFFIFVSYNNFSQEIIIKTGDTWSYFDNGYLNSNWMHKSDFKDWKTGISPLGYGDKKVLTNISFGNNSNNKEITKYFKKNITINNHYLAYELRAQIDDGAVIYINGKELFRSNISNSIINNPLCI
ncbi:MAG: hypothetical protein V3V28_09135 [Polaribacter sp.]|uniref:hypothetical protein n=1 Tax=Polaribacter sp. TaxID=1920175 RepID=UPI002F350462